MSNTISERSSKLYQILNSQNLKRDRYRLFDNEPLLDSFFALYDLFSNQEAAKRDKNISNFLRKFKSAIDEIRSLRPQKDDFEILKTIGRGHFGEVHVVREKGSSEIFAMKILKKASTLSNDNTAFYEEERDVMAFSSSPWIVNLQYAFQDTENLYLVMEFLPGGDLLNLLTRYDDQIMEENDATFYMAEIVAAVHVIHTIGYVHRDIKPENILLDMTGHLKLADFGSAAKLTNNRVVCKMPVGTPEYIAPEVLQSMNSNCGFYGTECDWWSVGVVCYEMLCGNVPFQADGILKLYSQIMKHKESLEFPDDVTLSDAAVNLIKGLLDEQKQRLGYSALAQHEFFKNIDFSTLKNIKPPFIPKLKDNVDTSNFEKFTATKITSANPVPPSVTNTIPFLGFTFTRNLSAMESCSRSAIPRTVSTEENVNKSKDYDKVIENFNKKINDLELNTKKLETDCSELTKELVRKTDSIVLLETTINNLTVEKDKLKNNLTQVSFNVEDSEDLKNKIKNISELYELEKKRYTELINENEFSKLKLTNLNTELESSNKQLKIYEDKILELEKNITKNSDEFKFSLNELQQLLDKSSGQFQEKIKAANDETKKYRELYDEYEKKVTNIEEKTEKIKFEVIESQKIEFTQKIHELEELCEKKDNEIKNSEFLTLKLNQIIRSLENQNQQNDSKIKDLEKNNTEINDENKSIKQNVENLLTNNQNLKNQNIEKDKKIIELQNAYTNLEILVQDERRRTMDKIIQFQKNIDENLINNEQKSREMNELLAQKREVEINNRSLSESITKNTLEIDRLNSIIAAQKTSNFALSQQLEESNEKIRSLRQETESLTANILSINSAHKEQIFKLETTLAQHKNLIAFLNIDVQGKKGLKITKMEPDKKQSVNRKYRDVEKQLELERNECLRLNSELTKLKQEIRDLKSSTLTTNIDKYSNDISSLVESTENQGDHIFNTSICHQPNTCFICLRPITYASIIVKCTICRICFHSSCQSQLPTFSCHPITPLLHVENLIDLSFAYKIYPGLDSNKTVLPFQAYLSIPNLISNNKYDWRKHLFELTESQLTIKTEDENSEETGTISFSAMKIPCIIRSSVHTCDILFTPMAQIGCVFGIEINHTEIKNFKFYNNPINDAPQTSTILYLLAPSLEEKRIWVRLLNDIVGHHVEVNMGDPLVYLDTNNFINITCVHMVSEELILIGYSLGLSFYKANDKTFISALDSKIECHSLYRVGPLLFGLFDHSRNLCLVYPDKKSKSIFSLVPKKNMRLSLFGLENLTDCFEIHYGEVRNDQILLYVSRYTELNCIKLTSDCHVLSSFKVNTGDIPISSCVGFEKSVVTCQDKFYVYNIEENTRKEFLCADDENLAFIIYGSNSESNYPMNVFLINRTNNAEFLICCSEFGLVVDKEGRRVSTSELRWDQIPLSFYYYHKHLVICYSNMMEVRNFNVENISNLSEIPSWNIPINCPLILTQNEFNSNEMLISYVNMSDYSMPLYRISLKTMDKRNSSLGSNKVVQASFKRDLNKSTSLKKNRTFLSRIIK